MVFLLKSVLLYVIMLVLIIFLISCKKSITKNNQYDERFNDYSDRPCLSPKWFI